MRISDWSSDVCSSDLQYGDDDTPRVVPRHDQLCNCPDDQAGEYPGNDVHGIVPCDLEIFMISGACLDSTFFEQRASPCCIWLWTPTVKDVGSTLPARCAGTIDRERASGGSGIWQHEHDRDVSFSTAAGPADGNCRS